MFVKTYYLQLNKKILINASEIIILSATEGRTLSNFYCFYIVKKKHDHYRYIV